MGVMAAIPGRATPGGVVPGRLVYRPVMGRVLTVCYGAFAVWWLIAGLSGGGRASVSGTGIAWLVAVGAVMYAVLWRPAVVVDTEGVQLLNVVRDVRIPWAALEGVETRYALTLFTAERRWTSWAAGAPGRGSAFARGVRSRSGGDRSGPDATGGSPPASGRDASGTEGHLPRAGWLPDGMTPDRSSRDLRSDSGAAAFMVEQGWLGWRDRPGARDEAGAPLPPVGVRWNVPVVVGIPVLVTVAVLAGFVGT